MEFSFNGDHAKLYGITEAILLQYLYLSIIQDVNVNKIIDKNKVLEVTISDAEIENLFDFFSYDEVHNALESLITKGVFLSGKKIDSFNNCVTYHMSVNKFRELYES